MSAEEVARLARRLTVGLYVHHAAMTSIQDPGCRPPLSLASHGFGAEGTIARKDGGIHAYDWAHHTEAARTDPTLAADLNRAFLVNALVSLAHGLDDGGYFDRAPILEMVRHLRNAAVHGNRFDIRDPGQLLQWPAHNRDAAWLGTTTFEITPELDGTVLLFDYMAMGDVLDVIGSVGTYLLR